MQQPDLVACLAVEVPEPSDGNRRLLEGTAFTIVRTKAAST